VRGGGVRGDRVEGRRAPAPGWFHNLTAEPNVEIQVGRERIPARARIAEGEERSRLWARADDVNQGQYTIYQSLTKRPIPVVVLEPR
jgi:F420H(2)-dependent quinone reductase